MIQAGRPLPVASFGVKLTQKSTGIIGIALRIEGFIKTTKRVRMKKQIDLQAPRID